MKQMLAANGGRNAGRAWIFGYRENYAKRLRRIEGQVRGIAKMIDETSTAFMC